MKIGILGISGRVATRVMREALNRGHEVVGIDHVKGPNVDDAVDFCARMNRDFCVDISAQTYKPNCPPVALTKLPLIVTESMADRLLALFGAALAQTAGREGRA